MKDFTQFGQRLKDYRQQVKETTSEAAIAMGIKRPYLSRLENGHEKPSLKILEIIANHYELASDQISNLKKLLGYQNFSTDDPNFTRRGVKEMQAQTQTETERSKEIQVTIPDNKPILYSDAAYVTSNPYGVTIDFAQSVASTNRQNVVARLGLSWPHVERIVEVLNEHLKRIREGEKTKRES